MFSTLMLKIKPLDESLIQLYVNHQVAYSGDSGLDLFFPQAYTVPGGTRGNLIDLRIQCEMMEIFYQEEDPDVVVRTANKSFMLVPRSSIYKTPIRQSNGIGIFDAGYRGNTMVPVDNIDMPGSDWTIHKYSRLFQIISPDLRPFACSVVNELSPSERGERGWGSSGT